MKIYSGNCFMGTCGKEAPFKDVDGKKLYIGDLVLIYRLCDGKIEVYPLDITPSAVVENDGEMFVMGIRAAKISTLDEDVKEGWAVKKVKDWKDCLIGEKWGLYFNFRED